MEVSDTPSFGRTKIKLPIRYVDRTNVADVIARTLATHETNSSDCKRLYDIFTGKQAILGREKKFRPEINNRFSVNHANEIVSFKTSYLLFEPIIYVARDGVPGYSDDVNDKVSVLNAMMSLRDKAAHDIRLATLMHICGHAYRMALPLQKSEIEDGFPPFDLYTLDPRTNYVVYSSALGEKPLCSVSYTDVPVSIPGGTVPKRLYSVYTDTHYYEIMDDKVITEERHRVGMVPVVEYINNEARLGSFEIVEGILDAINTLACNRVDATEQTVQSIMVFVNCDIDKEKFDEIREQCGIVLKSVEGLPSEIKLLTADLKQADQQVLMDSLYNQLLFITGMPSQHTGNGSDSSNNGATIVRNGWYNAEARAKETDTLWSASENLLRKIVLRICSETGVLDLKPAFVTDKFTRRNYEDLQARSQVLVNLLNNEWVAPHEAYVVCGLFADPEEAYKEALDWREQHPKEIDPPPPKQPSPETNETPDTEEAGE